MPVAGGEMVIDHADSLRKGIDDDGAAEFEAALLQLLGQALTHLGLGGYLVAAAEAVRRHPALHMFPNQLAKPAGFLFLDLEPQPGAFDGGLDLGAAADGALILEQPV